jgi:RHS repeat-associated protein
VLNLPSNKINSSSAPRRPSYGSVSSPFGSSLPNRAWSDVSRGYRYGFNGKEKDTETANDAYDFSARIYDGRLGRFCSIDKYFDKNTSFSAYVFADDCPIVFIDYDGYFRMSKKDQSKYPQLSNLLKNIQTTVHNDPSTWNAFKKALGLTEEEANSILEWGKGPKVNIGRVKNGDVALTSSNGDVKISKKLVKQLEGKKQRGKDYNSEGLVFFMYMTVLHEGQHYAEYILGKTKLTSPSDYDPYDENTEAGIVFEKLAMGDVVYPDNANQLQENNFNNRVTPAMEKPILEPNPYPSLMGNENEWTPYIEIPALDNSLSANLKVDTTIQR